MKILITKEKIFHFILLIIFYLIFEFRYYYFVFAKFEFAKFYFEFSFYKYLTAKILFVLSLFIINKIKSKFLYISAVLFNLFVFIPNLILFQFNSAPLIISLLIILFFIFLAVDLFKIPSINIVSIKPNQILPIFLITILLLLIPFVVTYGFKIDWKIFSFGDEIYKVRREVKQFSNLYTSYLYFPLKNFLIPVLIIYAFIDKKKYFLIIGVIMVLYLFMIIPHKSTFFSIFVLIAFYYFKDYYNKLSLTLLGLLGLLILSIFATTILNSNLLESIFLRRMFFIPAQLNTAYFKIFNQNHLYLSHSLFSYFIDYPYKLEPAFYVADKYFGKPEMSANNGFISDGFMNFGLIGSIVFTYIISGLFKFFDGLNISSRFYGVFFLFLKLTMGSALLTMFFTHGLFIFIIISIIFLKNTANYYE